MPQSTNTSTLSARRDARSGRFVARSRSGDVDDGDPEKASQEIGGSVTDHTAETQGSDIADGPKTHESDSAIGSSRYTAFSTATSGPMASRSKPGQRGKLFPEGTPIYESKAGEQMPLSERYDGDTWRPTGRVTTEASWGMVRSNVEDGEIPEGTLSYVMLLSDLSGSERRVHFEEATTEKPGKKMPGRLYWAET